MDSKGSAMDKGSSVSSNPGRWTPRQKAESLK